MNEQNEICCFCLNTSDSPLLDLSTKSEQDGLSYFDEISKTLPQLTNVINNFDYNILVCGECCVYIEMVYEFNRSSINNLRIYSSHKGIEKTKTKQVKGKEIKLIIVDSNTVKDVKALTSNDTTKIENKRDTRQINVEGKITSIQHEYLDEIDGLLFEHQDLVSDAEDEKNIQDHSTNFHSEHRAISHPKVRKKKSLNRCTSANIGNKNITCKECNKSFIRPYNLKQHMYIHSGEKRHKCTVCQKSFTQRSVLRTHMFTHTGYKPHACDICGWKFRNKQHLIDHRLIHTGEKPYPCNICNKYFRSKSKLTDHKRVHSEVKLYSCEFCDRRFRQKPSLDTHKLLHTHGEARIHPCDICNKLFSRKSYIKTHKLSQHKNELKAEMVNVELDSVAQ